ncbi:metallophosphoesterase family protein (plasmid) [Pseudarthrobacter sp. P1]|uniref:metallophosphoesterase family protein n=1 Tax=Pseudarthrobacter sp. P1 TaxID=3418418 RepID=UPI003CFAC56F
MAAMETDSHGGFAPPRNTKILIGGDWHGNVGWMQVVLRQAARDGFTMIVHVGDLAVLWPGEMKFTHRLARLLDELGITMVFIDGNHDVHPKLRALPLNGAGFGIISDRLLYAPRGHRWMIGGLRFGALGGAYSIDRQWRVEGQSWWMGEEVIPADVERLGHDPLDVLITHEVPAGIDLVSEFDLPEFLERESFISRQLVREAVRNTTPRRVFSGHWHQSRTGLMPGMETRVHVLHKEFCPGNLASLDLESLAVERYHPVPAA